MEQSWEVPFFFHQPSRDELNYKKCPPDYWRADVLARPPCFSWFSFLARLSLSIWEGGILAVYLGALYPCLDSNNNARLFPLYWYCTAGTGQPSSKHRSAASWFPLTVFFLLLRKWQRAKTTICSGRTVRSCSALLLLTCWPALRSLAWTNANKKQRFVLTSDLLCICFVMCWILALAHYVIYRPMIPSSIQRT